MTLIGLGTLLLVGGATAAINSYNAYLPLIIKEATATPSPMMVCSNPSNPIPIPEQSSQDVTDTIQISSARPISDLNVPLDISHTYVGDLVVSLQHVETNTTVKLLDRPGYDPNPLGCKRADIQAILDDEADTLAEDMCNPKPPAITGRVIPNQPLSDFDGQSTYGSWRLIISDRISQDGGALNNWCLTFETTGP
jgi:hypothetical protein